MFDNIRTLLGIDDNDHSKDKIIFLQIKNVTADVLAYCNIEELPEALEGTVVDIVVIRINRMGSEGMKTESIGQVSTNYVDDADAIPQPMKAKLNRFRRVKFA